MLSLPSFVRPLQVAFHCLAEAFSLDIASDSAKADLLSSKDLTLSHVFACGLAAIEGRPLPEKPVVATEAASAGPATPGSAAHWSGFLATMKEKGYFGTLAPGSRPYNARLAVLAEKYSDKYALTVSPIAGELGAADDAKVRGNRLLALQDYAGAEEEYTIAIGSDPTGHIFYVNRSVARVKLNKLAAAVADCRRAIALSPAYVKAHYRLGQALQASGDTAAAITAYEEAAACCKDDPATLRDVQDQIRQLKRAQGASQGGRSAVPATGPGAAGAGAGAGGMGGLGAMLNDPNLMSSLGAMLGGGGGGGAGAGGAGGAGGLAALLNNPAMQGMMQSMMKSMGGAGGAAMEDDAEEEEEEQVSVAANDDDDVADVATPAAAAAGAGAGAGGEDPLSALRSDPQMARIAEEVRTQGPAAAMKYLGDPAVMAKLGPLMQAMMGGGAKR